MFNDGEQDMQAIMELFHFPALAEVAEEFRARIEAAAPFALFVPHEWDMTRPGRASPR